MWNAEIDSSDGDRVCRVRVLRNGKPATYSEIIKGWRHDTVFRTFFNRLLAEAPYCGYLWETPAVSRNNSSRAFEFVFVDNPQLAKAVCEPDVFASHFEATDPKQGVAVFSNLGGDALLVAPIPRGPLDAYTHLAAFVRRAPAEQQHQFWRIVGEAVADRLSDRPLWLSTNGLGVSWLHARLDTRPKYYTFGAYRKSE